MTEYFQNMEQEYLVNYNSANKKLMTVATIPKGKIKLYELV